MQFTELIHKARVLELGWDRLLWREEKKRTFQILL